MLPSTAWLYVHISIHRIVLDPFFALLTSCSNHAQQIWVYQVDDDGQFDYQVEDTVRFRVEAEYFVDQSPLGPDEDPDQPQRNPPYSIEASMGEDGLGPVLWWD
jgi:DNA-directed RNA polymerase III subunit RPC8